MMPVEWPVAAPPSGQHAMSRAPGRDRLSSVRRDFFLPPDERLTEQERALMVAMLRSLVSEVAGELRAALPQGMTAANDGGDDRLFDQLFANGTLDDPALVATLLRRADEEGLTNAAFARANRRSIQLLPSLVGHDNGPVAAAAMALVMARGRRRDWHGQGLLTVDDLEEASLDVVVSAVAAGLRPSIAALHGDIAADQGLATAIRAAHLAHDPERGVDRLTGDLVAALESAGRMDDELLLAAAGEGEMAFVAFTLARRAAIAPGEAFAELCSGDARRTMTLLRMAGASRDFAASLMAGAGDVLGLSDPAAAMAVFDSLADSDVEERRSWLAAPSAYRSACRGHHG